MSAIRILALAASLIISSQASAKDVRCRELDRFVADQVKERGSPVPLHWAEVHFGVADDPFATWSIGCLHSGDPGSKRFCDWSMRNAGGEFGDTNFQRLALGCMGYQFPTSAASRWKVTEGYFQSEVRNGIFLTMEVTKARLPGMETAIRFFFEFSHSTTLPAELGPILPFAQGAKQTQ